MLKFSISFLLINSLRSLFSSISSIFLKMKNNNIQKKIIKEDAEIFTRETLIEQVEKSNDPDYLIAIFYQEKSSFLLKNFIAKRMILLFKEEVEVTSIIGYLFHITGGVKEEVQQEIDDLLEKNSHLF